MDLYVANRQQHTTPPERTNAGGDASPADFMFHVLSTIFAVARFGARLVVCLFLRGGATLT